MVKRLTLLRVRRIITRSDLPFPSLLLCPRNRDRNLETGFCGLILIFSRSKMVFGQELHYCELTFGHKADSTGMSPAWSPLLEQNKLHGLFFGTPSPLSKLCVLSMAGLAQLAGLNSKIFLRTHRKSASFSVSTANFRITRPAWRTMRPALCGRRQRNVAMVCRLQLSGQVHRLNPGNRL